MPRNLLSVVMPTHNRPNKLLRAARSVLSQADIDTELVVVDDASSDDTPSVADQLSSDRRVRVIRNDRSVGPGAARNLGIAVASGELLSFCDDDDAWLPGAGSALTEALDRRPDLGFVTSWHRVVHDRSGSSVDYRGPTSFGAAELLWFNFVAIPFGIIRRSQFRDLRFDEELPPCEDWDLWLRCAEHRPLMVVPEVYYAYHQHGGDRVTHVNKPGRRGGRPAFLAKHRSDMSEACVAYHEAVMALEEGGRNGMLRALGGASLDQPVAATVAGSVLATGSVASTIGIHRGDPGLPARVMRRQLDLIGSRHAGTGAR